jgi:hypothetical protein
MGIDVHLSIEITFVNGYASGRVLVAEVVVHHDELGPLVRRRLAATIDELIDVTEEFPSIAGRGVRRQARECLGSEVCDALAVS